MSLTVSPAKIVEESDSPLLSCPPAWRRKPLGEVAEILNGYAFKSAAFVQHSDGAMPLLRIRDIFNNETSIAYNGEYDERYIVRRGDLVVGMDGDFNVARWRGRDALLNQRVCKLTANPKYLDDDYLARILPGYLRAIQEWTSSTTVTHLSSRDIARIPIPVPPLADQQRMAGLVREATSRQQSVRKHLLLARDALTTFRRSVLEAACTGRLTAAWRDESSSGEFAEGLVSEIFRQRRSRLGRRFKASDAKPHKDAGDLPEGWCWTSLGSLVDVATGATPLRKRTDYYGGDIPWITSGAVNAGRVMHAAETITPLAIKETNAKPFPPGTLLIAMYGEGQTRGRVAELGIAAATNQALAALVFADPAAEDLRAYLRLFLTRNYERIRATAVGGVQPNLSLGIIKDMPVPLPPIPEQREIVKRTEYVLSKSVPMTVKLDSASRLLEKGSNAVLGRFLSGGSDVESSGDGVPAC
ncbi:MAG TPA: restriction endonuclease subunit S [Acidimicrobiales bacterium]|nr:restriction endonuclease subunit S [Acidimicrobiales bacterium]